MRIAKATVSLHHLPMILPLVEKPAGDGLRVICEIETTDGHRGFGMSGRWMAHGVAAAIKNDLLPVIKDMDIRDIEAIHGRLWPEITPRGIRAGAGMTALSCLDMAIWDAVGRATGRTVAQMFGGARKKVPVYVTFGFGVYSEDQLVQLARELADQGFGCLKVLVGVAKGGVAEDPVRGNDARELADLRRMGRIPVAIGQFDGYASRFREWIEAGAIDIVMANSMYNGGFTETRRVAALSQIYNLPLSDAGGGGLFSLHHVAGFRNGTMLEMHLGNARLERALFTNAPEPENGFLAVPEGPGIGLELNRDLMRDSLIREV